MASSIYNLLSFPTNDPVLSSYVEPLSANASMQMNLMPSLVNTWQQEDMANDDTGDYFFNPAQVCITTSILAANTTIDVLGGNTVVGTTNTISSLLYNTWHKANTITNTTAPAFLYHTNRMSNVTEIGTDVTNPHYELAIGYGKIIMMMVNKTDNVQNNSPLLGCFGSILAANVISANANTFLTYSQQYANSINISTVDDGFGNVTTTYTSNLTLTDAQSFSNQANNVYDLMTNYKAQDTTFFQNTKNVVDLYNAVGGFSKLGQTETTLIMNHIGTDKIKTRLNSQ